MRIRVSCGLYCCLCLALSSCGLALKLRQKHEAPDQTAESPEPGRRGWALMMSDDEFAKYKAAATGAPATGAAGATGAAPGSDGALFDFSHMVPGGAAGATTQIIWQRSATQAGSQSRLKGLPLLIYATHSGSQPCRDMENSLMAQPDFRTLAQENFIPLLVDYSDQDTSRSDMYRELKSRFEVRGYPTLLVIMPDGTEVERLSGYKLDYQDRYLKAIQSAVGKSEKLAAERRQRLEHAQDYRLWKNKDGKPVFARLTALDANMATFTSEWGESFKTFVTRLSEEDQQWIAARRK